VKRHLFNLPAGLSMLLCVASAFIWIRSYNVWDVFRLPYSHALGTNTYRGAISVFWANPPRRWLRSTWNLHSGQEDLLIGGWGRFVVQGDTAEFGDPTGVIAVGIWFYTWFLTTFFLILPLIWAVHYRMRSVRRDRERKGKCIKCGYDLRGSPDRCPECGVVPTFPANAASR
jgi:hypothetical protein